MHFAGHDLKVHTRERPHAREALRDAFHLKKKRAMVDFDHERNITDGARSAPQEKANWISIAIKH
jgi:hypothetical protein